jgi:Domain of unknown function (DUF4384)
MQTSSTGRGFARLLQAGMVGAILLLLPGASYSQSQTVVVKGSAIFSPELTYAEVERKALDNAFAEAIREVAGVDVQSEVYGAKSEVTGAPTVGENKFVEVYSAINRSASFGRVVHYTVRSNSLAEQELAGRKVRAIVLEVECEVVKESGRPDPSFTLSMELNGQVFYDRGNRIKNDEVVIKLTCTQDCYVTLFAVSRDTVTVLFPNELAPYNYLTKNKTFEFPPEDMRQYFHLRVGVPEGLSRTTEMILAVATKEDVRFKGGQVVGGLGVVPTYVGALEQLNRWLVQIAPDKRSEAHEIYEVRKE